MLKFLFFTTLHQCLVTDALIQGCLFSKTDKFDWLRRLGPRDLSNHNPRLSNLFEVLACILACCMAKVIEIITKHFGKIENGPRFGSA